MTTTQARPGKPAPMLPGAQGARTLRPALAQRGAWAGLAVTGTALLVWTGLGFHSGWGWLVDALIAVALGWTAAGVAAGALLLLGRLLRWVPARLRAAGLAAAVVIGSMGMWAALWFGPLVTVVLLAAGMLAGAGLAGLARAWPVRGRRLARSGAAAAVGLVVLCAGLWWLAAGADPPDPGGPAPSGPYQVRTLSYGSGSTDRPEFGAAATVRTAPVNASALVEGWDGWLGARRTAYWGFGPDAMPLNATVWTPDARGPFPLAILVHGNAAMALPSDTGYTWLAEDLASQGYVVASVDQNFLNLAWLRGWQLRADNEVRAWLLLEHLRLWRDWDADPSHPLHGIADLDRIALIGHSRGGGAAAVAAAFDRLERHPDDATISFDAGFGIDAVVGLAPADNYAPGGRPVELDGTSYLVIQGGLDGDVFWFDGLGQFDRVSLPEDRFGVKAAVWLPDGNHGQFNTVWGRHDLAGLPGAVLDTRPIMAPEVQRAAAGRAIAAFLDAVLQDDPSRLDVLQDPRHPAWSETPGVITRYADTTETTVLGFIEDSDPSTGTLPGTTVSAEGLGVWREEPVPQRRGEGRGMAVALGWLQEAAGSPPVYRVALPDGWTPPSRPLLTLSVSDSGQLPPAGRAVDGPTDLTVEAVDVQGRTIRVPLSDLGGVPPASRSRRFKAPLPEWAQSIEPVAQTFRIPLDGRWGTVFDPAQLREVRLVFDRTPQGFVLLEHLGIAGGR